MYNYNIYYACFLWNNIVDRIRQKHTLEDKQKMTDCSFNILNWIFYNDSKCISIYDVLFVILCFLFLNFYSLIFIQYFNWFHPF